MFPKIEIRLKFKKNKVKLILEKKTQTKFKLEWSPRKFELFLVYRLCLRLWLFLVTEIELLNFVAVDNAISTEKFSVQIVEYKSK